MQTIKTAIAAIALAACLSGAALAFDLSQWQEAERLRREAEPVALKLEREARALRLELRGARLESLAVLSADDPTSAVLDARARLARIAGAMQRTNDAATSYTITAFELAPVLESLAIEEAGE